MTTTTTLAKLENICHRLCTLLHKTTSMNAFALPARHRHKAETKATLPFVGGKPQFHQEFYTAARCRELCLEVVALQQSIRSMLPPPQQQQQQQLRPPANLAALHSSPTPSSPVMPDVESPLFPAGAVPVSSTLGWTSPRPSAPSSSLPSIPRTCQQCGTAKTPEWRRGPHGSQTLCNACGLQWIKASRSGIGLAPISTPQHKPVHKRFPHQGRSWPTSVEEGPGSREDLAADQERRQSFPRS